jgi:hypothetical protein
LLFAGLALAVACDSSSSGTTTPSPDAGADAQAMDAAGIEATSDAPVADVTTGDTAPGDAFGGEGTSPDATTGDAPTNTADATGDAVTDVANVPETSTGGCPPVAPSGVCGTPGNLPQPPGCTYGNTCCFCGGMLPGPFSWSCNPLGNNGAACPASPPSDLQPCTTVVSCMYCVDKKGRVLAQCNGSAWSVAASN